jgi:ribosomal protein S16
MNAQVEAKAHSEKTWEDPTFTPQTDPSTEIVYNNPQNQHDLGKGVNLTSRVTTLLDPNVHFFNNKNSHIH